MKLYLECNMGAAGDMLTAALYELLPRREEFLRKMDALALPGVKITPEPSEKCGILGTHMNVTVYGEEETSDDVHEHEHSHTHVHEHTHTHSHSHAHGLSYGEILEKIGTLDISEKAKSDALAVYKLLAEAEGEVHGAPTEQIHFHEVGTLDALADIVGVCVLLDMLGVTEISASAVHVGSGNVRCAHGILPVPTPATALLLRDIPIYGGRIKGELCTPTGAALLRHFVSRFGDMEPMSVTKIGYGMGTKDFENCNCVRAFLGEGVAEGRDKVLEMSCNLDDMTAEAIGFAAEELLAAGALDVFTSPIYMKKSRPATLFTVLCRPDDDDKFTRLIFRHTTTLGVRATEHRRAVLTRRTEERATKYGAVRVKIAEGYGVRREKAEYEDVARLARENGVGIAEIN
jgi:uncharacterized protein (TIGR00299 family) protein